ncbi:hypothetical protein BaRGS_00024747 [Batillaria attramentaria]|uniref:Uncharacterized protein n=1 Tax=Batillaria attramentaria TaxID=370345 RepID=A0ABD0KAA9_9CAEN
MSVSFRRFVHISSWKGMPKKQRAKGADSDSGAAASPNQDDGNPVQQTSPNTVTIKILAKPGAKHNAVTDITREGVGVQIAAPPVDGEANAELVKYLASILGLRKSDVSLDKGSKSRNKSVIVSGSSSRDEIVSRLKSQIESDR